MKTVIPTLESKATATAASDWLRWIIAGIGPCFHFDTPPEDYILSGGKALLSRIECDRLARGLDRALEILGDNVFEDVCLQAVWEQLGVQYDAQLDRLVPIAS